MFQQVWPWPVDNLSFNMKRHVWCEEQLRSMVGNLSPVLSTFSKLIPSHYHLFGILKYHEGSALWERDDSRKAVHTVDMLKFIQCWQNGFCGKFTEHLQLLRVVLIFVHVPLFQCNINMLSTFSMNLVQLIKCVRIYSPTSVQNSH
jgi:hypothetical protein